MVKKRKSKSKSLRRRNERVDAPDAFSKETDDQVRSWLQKSLERPSNFGISRDSVAGDQMFATWSLGPVVVHRDSPILDQANWAALRKRLESDPSLEDDWGVTHAGHWAVGWVDHLSFRAVDPDGSPSRMARIMKDWNDQLSAYPIADEELYSAMQEECFAKHFDSDAIDAVRAAGLDEDELPKDWLERLAEATSDYERGYHSEDCPFVREEDFAEAIAKLGWVREENPNGPLAIKKRRRKPTSQRTYRTRRPRGRRGAPYRRHLQPTPGSVMVGTWERRGNPKKASARDAGDAALGAGAGSLLGGLGGFIVGSALGGVLGLATGRSFGFGLSAATGGGLLGGYAGTYVGAYQGGKRYAPQGRERGAAVGGAVGNWVFGPVGAAAGAYIGARPNPVSNPKVQGLRRRLTRA